MGVRKGPYENVPFFYALRVYYILITRKTTENSILVITPLYTYMKRFFTFLLNRLFWLGDFFLLFIELNIELVIRFVEFFLETIESLYQSILQFRNLKTIRKASNLPRPRSKPTSFAGQVLVTIIQEMAGGFVLILVFYTFPIFGTIGTTIADWIGYHRNNLIGLVVMTILFYLPQQRIFRDPVTRFFFEREWFRNYGEAFLFTQFLSFLILVLLLINAWSWFGAL
jgi:hypothetical protein